MTHCGGASPNDEGRAACGNIAAGEFGILGNGLSRKVRVRPQPLIGPTPMVSVVIPCYNYAHYLPAAVASVLAQKGVEVQVIVVDDASIDDSLVVAERLAAEDSRVVVISHRKNGGPVQTFNDGLLAVAGEFLVRLDADDMLTPGSLERSTAAARAYPSVGLVYGHPYHFFDQPPTALQSRVRRWLIWPGRQWLADRCSDAVNVITAPEVLMRSSVVMHVGGQMPIKIAHDMEMWFRIAAFSDVLYIQGPDQALHRDHPGSLSTRMTHPLDDFMERHAVFSTLFSGSAGAIPQAADMERTARAAMAQQVLTTAVHEYDRNRFDAALTDQCITLARQMDPEVTGTRTWARLQRRIVLGSAAVRRRPWFAASARVRRLQSIVREQIWHRRGTYTWR
jgi:hypothetical protein